MTRREMKRHEERMRILAIITTIVGLIPALILAFMIGSNSATRSSKAYRYDLECLAELHDNPLIECRKEK